MDALDPILALRPFVPARDYDLSRRFYEALGFVPTHRDDHVTILKLGSFSFILQNFYVREAAENCMLQLLVRASMPGGPAPTRPHASNLSA